MSEGSISIDFFYMGPRFYPQKRENANLKRTTLGLALILGTSQIANNNGIPSRLSKLFSEENFHKRRRCKFDNKQSHLLNFFDLFVQPTDHLICGVWDLFYHHQADKRIHLKTQRMQLQDKAQGNKTASLSSKILLKFKHITGQPKSIIHIRKFRAI